MIRSPFQLPDLIWQDSNSAAGQGHHNRYMVMTMTKATFPLPLDPAPERLGSGFSKETLESRVAVALLVGVACVALSHWTEETDRKLREVHLRGERLAA